MITKELMTNKVGQLRKMCTEANLNNKGRKAGMVSRLVKAQLAA